MIYFLLTLEELLCSDFDRHLGLGSVAWKAWEEISACLRNENARAPLVGASKLLAAKRLRLIPLEDSYVRSALKTSRRDIWKVIHCVVRDRQIHQVLGQVRGEVPDAIHLTIHRTLDIIAWRKHQGHRREGSQPDRVAATRYADGRAVGEQEYMATRPAPTCLRRAVQITDYRGSR